MVNFLLQLPGKFIVEIKTVIQKYSLFCNNCIFGILFRRSKNAGTVNNHSINKDIPRNAVFSDTTYTFSEGNIKGSFKVNWAVAGPSSVTSSETNVKIHGLGTAAYQDSSAFASSNDLKSVDAVTLGGSSLQQILRYVDNKISESSTGTNPWG